MKNGTILPVTRTERVRRENPVVPMRVPFQSATLWSRGCLSHSRQTTSLCKIASITFPVILYFIFVVLMCWFVQSNNSSSKTARVSKRLTASMVSISQSFKSAMSSLRMFSLSCCIGFMCWFVGEPKGSRLSGMRRQNLPMGQNVPECAGMGRNVLVECHVSCLCWA